MTKVYCYLLFTLVCASATEAQNQPQLIIVQPARPGQKMEDGKSKMWVDGKVVAQTYCGGGSDLFSVSMKISLRFTNLSNRPVILARKIPGPLAIRVAKNPEALRIGRFEYNPSIDPAVAELPKSPLLGNTPDSKYFSILPPGETFETRISTVIFGTQTRKKGSVGKGKHVLQLGLETWPYQWPWYTPVDASKLAGRWSEYGHLITGNVYTEPVPFIIPEKVRVEPCE